MSINDEVSNRRRLSYMHLPNDVLARQLKNRVSFMLNEYRALPVYVRAELADALSEAKTLCERLESAGQEQSE